MDSIGGLQGIGAPISHQIGGESFIRHVGSDKLIFDFHEGSGTTVYDKSRNNNNGTFGAGAAAPTWLRNSLYFDGDAYISIADNPSLNFGTGDFSIILLMSAENNTARQIMIADDGVAATTRGWEFTYRGETESDPIRVQMNDGAGTAYSINYNTSGLAGKGWNFVAFVAKRSSLGTIYFNGVNVASSNITGFPGSIDNTNIIAIGRQAHYDLRYFVGGIDNVRILNKGLSGIECQQEYLANKFRGNN